MNDLISLLRQFRNRRVLVVGDGGNDVWSDIERGRDFEEGMPTYSVTGSLQTPAMGRFVSEQLRMLGAAVSCAAIGEHKHMRFVGSDAQFGLRLMRDCGRAPKAIESCVSSHNAVIISDYGKGVCTPEVCRAVIDAANEHKIPVLVDPGRNQDWDKYDGATCIKYSAEHYAGHTRHRYLVRTDQASGMLLMETRDNEINVGAIERVEAYTPAGPFVDAIGCGDICAAVLGLTLAVGSPLLDGCRLAAVIAGMKTQYRGCRVIAAEEVERELAAQTKAATG